MAVKKFACPPIAATGSGSFSDDLVGFQLVQGGGLTQGNFEFTVGVTEKTNREFYTGVFSDPVNLKSMGVESVAQSKLIFENNFKVYPNYDLSEVTNFTLYGSMTKRISTSVTTIINYFPAALEMQFIGINYTTGTTASNVVFDSIENTTKFDLDLSRIRNPFGIDFTINSKRNLSLKEVQVSTLRDMTNEYKKYSLFYLGNEFPLILLLPTTSLTSGLLTIYVQGNPFSGQTQVFNDIIVRPNDYEVNKVFNESLDDVENFILNRTSVPKYTAQFKIPQISNGGQYSVTSTFITWPISGKWNLDIVSSIFTTYLTKLNAISEDFDSYRTNLIARFLTTDAFKEFDTVGQKMQKVLQIYGRSFDEINKFINALAFMNSVHYNTGNDIPSQLLKNLAQTLGWNTAISPISNDNFLNSVFGGTDSGVSHFAGLPTQQTPDELNYQFYKNLILNSAFLFKSKGTRKSIEVLLRLIGAPDALVEFNEYVYLADQRINMSSFETQYAQISGGTYSQEIPVLNPADVFTIFGVPYTGTTTTTSYEDVNFAISEYPVDDEGYPSVPEPSDSYYFQIGAGWFESTPKHRSPEQINLTNAVFTGSNPNYQTSLIPFSYGQIYLNRFRYFPYTKLGFNLRETIDNNKSWTNNEIGLRTNLDAGYNSRYVTDDDRLVLNVKNTEIFLNPAQGLAYDVWYMSRQYNYPIPNQGLKYIPPTPCNPNPVSNYPIRGGVDWTEINPRPGRKTFFEFAQTFWLNMINVRNRQHVSDGKTGGYPTLQSIYWKYLQSEENIGIANDNFTYQTMIQYVEGLGDYWVRLIEQLVPATTIWNTGLKYENSIFHRQKFVYRRQSGCQLIPIPCNPCSLTANIFSNDCPLESVECSKYPWIVSTTIQDFTGVLGVLLNNYLTSNGYILNDCVVNSLNTEWFVDLRLNDVPVVTESFFNGIGYNTPGLSNPTTTDWDNALVTALDSLSSLGYDYYLTNEDTIIIYGTVCGLDLNDLNFKLNIGINFNILCS
jgi:hypothetical protein